MNRRHINRWAFSVVASLAGLAMLSIGVSMGSGDEPERPQSVRNAPATAPRKPGEADSAAEKQTQEKKSQASSPNLVERLIRKLFPQPRRRRAAGPVPMQGASKPNRQQDNTASVESDEIDARAPQNADRDRLLRKAEDHVQDGDFKSAVELLQRFLLDPQDDSLIRRPDGTWVSARSAAERLLQTSPQECRELYRLQYGPVAKSLLAEALATRDHDKLAGVACRFFHTEAGLQAANRLGTLHVDRGEFGLAARWFRKLLDAQAPLTTDPTWRAKAAWTFQQAGLADSRLPSRVSPDPKQANGAPSGAGSSARQLDSEGSSAPQQRLPPGWTLDSSHRETPQLNEWPLFFGTPSRTGSAVGGEPLLLPRWSRPTTYSGPLRSRLQVLMQDLEDQGKALIPAWFPLAVGGKIVSRTFSGIQVVDADTGQLLWETRDVLSADDLLSGLPGAPTAQVMQAMPFPGQQAVPQYVGGNADRHPLTGLLFRNGVYGIVGSDGEQLFVLEDHGVLSRRQPGRGGRFLVNGSRAADGLDGSSNRLRSYDLRSGRPLWDAGGTEMEEPFVLPLAGQYFFGVPVPDGEDVFVVGEKDHEIRLFVLDRRSGRPRWSQLLAFSDTEIENDLVRRWWPAQVAVDQGVAVCPTTVGWLVAVDRVSRSLLWAHRYAPPNPHTQNRNQSGAPFASLNSQWCPSAPVIADNRVVYTPAEEPVLVCLDLMDGTRLWQRAKERSLYIAGVFDRRVVLVGTDSVTALSLDDGAPLWVASFPSSAGRPSGVGVALKDRYFLPLSSGQLWSLDLNSGAVASKSYLPAGAPPLGNLAMYRGMLLSLSPRGLSSFEQREALEAEIRHRKARNPQDPWALLREAEMHRLKRDDGRTLTALRHIDTEALPAELRPQYRKMMTETLAAVIRADFEAHDAELKELGKFAESESERLLYQRLNAERLMRRGDHTAAFLAYWTLAEQYPVLYIAREDDLASPSSLSEGQRGAARVRLDRWAAGKLADLWEKLPPEDRAALDARIAATAQKALQSRVESRELRVESQTRAAEGRVKPSTLAERFVTLFRFHPDSFPIQRRLAEYDAAHGNFARAESRLLDLGRRADDSIAAEALRRLVGLLRQSGLQPDADHYAEILHREFSPTEPAGEHGGQEHPERVDEEPTANSGQRDLTASSVDADGLSGWGDIDLNVEQMGALYNSSDELQDLQTGSPTLPFFRERWFQADPQHGRLAVTRASDGALEWLLPLRSRPGTPAQDSSVSAPAVGHRLVLLHRGVLHCISPVDRRLLWTYPVETPAQASGDYRSPVQPMPEIMQTGIRFLAKSSLLHRAYQSGMLAAARPQYVCVYGRRRFTVLDAVTGDVCWQHEQLPPHTTIYGTDDVLYVVPPDNQAAAFRTLDGMRLDVPNVSALLGKAVYSAGNAFVVMESRPAGSSPERSPKIVLRRVDPLSGQDGWTVEFPNNTDFSLVDDAHLAALEQRPDAQRQLKLVDLNTGAVQTFEPLLPEAAFESQIGLYVLSDARRLYLLINKRRQGSYYYSTGGLPSLRINGPVIAFDRQTGREAWTQELTSQALVDPRLSHSPFLIFAARTYVREEAIRHWSLTLLVLDKQTGRRLVDTALPVQSSFRAMLVNRAERYVELRSFNQRIRLTAVEREPAASE